MSRQGTIDLIDDVEECLDTMKKSDKIKPVKIKSILENLRSALEYLANDTYDKYFPSTTLPRPLIYFPYGEQKHIDNFFIKKLKIETPDSSPMYAIFNSVQDIHTGEDWLNMMCTLTNDAKHRQPIPLKEDEVIKGIAVEAGGMGLIKVENSSNVVFSNNYVNGQKVEDFTFSNGNFKTSGTGIPLNITLTKEKKIKFHGVEYEVIPFLELCLNRIKEYIPRAYDALDTI